MCVCVYFRACARVFVRTRFWSAVVVVAVVVVVVVVAVFVVAVVVVVVAAVAVAGFAAVGIVEPIAPADREGDRVRPSRPKGRPIQPHPTKRRPPQPRQTKTKPRRPPLNISSCTQEALPDSVFDVVFVLWASKYGSHEPRGPHRGQHQPH